MDIKRISNINVSYRENPEQFWSTVQHLLDETPESYGDAATVCFLKILSEM